jgi:hypothetical protein
LACDFFHAETIRSPACTALRSSSTPPAGCMSWAPPRIRPPAGSPSSPGTC